MTGITIQIDELEKLKNTLSTLDPAKKAAIIKKVELFAESDAKPDVLDTDGNYQPEINKLDFVHVDFTGVGSEWDGGHYGVVWSVNPKFDSFVVIPTTSQSRKEYPDVFSIGKVLGLPRGNDTTLLVSDMTRVSRKRIKPVTFQHFTRGKITSRLKKEHVSRIEEAIAVSYGGQTTFERVLRDQTSVAMPDDLSVLYAWRFKPVCAKYNRSNNTLEYRLWISDQWNTLNMLMPKEQIRKSQKMFILDNLFSLDDTMRNSAEAEYRRLYK